MNWPITFKELASKLKVDPYFLRSPYTQSPTTLAVSVLVGLTIRNPVTVRRIIMNHSSQYYWSDMTL